MTVPTAEVTLVNDAMTWPELVLLSIVVLVITAAAIIAPLNRPRRNIIATDVLKAEGSRS